MTTHICRGNFRSVVGRPRAATTSSPRRCSTSSRSTASSWSGTTSAPAASSRCASCRRAKQVVLGLVTTKRGELESKDELKRRIEEAAKFAPLDQLCLSPQCGFSSTVEGNALTRRRAVARSCASSSRSPRRSGGPRDRLRELRRREPRGREVLRRVRRAARGACPACGAPNAPGRKFCGECGAPLGGAAAAPAAPSSRERAGGRAPARLRPVRRPRRLHARCRSRATPRRCASSCRATSTRAGG